MVDKPTANAARCPRCHHLTTTPSAANLHAFYCHDCKIEFEDEDDGTIGYGNPERFAERNERHQQNRQNQQRRPRR